MIPFGKKFGKPLYIVGGTDIKGFDKPKLTNIAKLKSQEHRVTQMYLKKKIDVKQFSKEVEPIRDKIKRISFGWK